MDSAERVASLLRRIERLERCVLSRRAADAEPLERRVHRVERRLTETVSAADSVQTAVNELDQLQQTQAWRKRERVLLHSPETAKAVLIASVPLLEDVSPLLERCASLQGSINTVAIRSESMLLLPGCWMTNSCRGSGAGRAIASAGLADAGAAAHCRGGYGACRWPGGCVLSACSAVVAGSSRLGAASGLVIQVTYHASPS
jgi:hypothetical protein